MRISVLILAISAIVVNPQANAESLQPLMGRVGIAADNVIKAAHKPKPRLSIVANKAATLATMLMPLVDIPERDPAEARAHMNSLRQIGYEMLSLSAALGSASLTSDEAEGAAEIVHQFEAVAESIRDTAQAY